MSIVPYGPNAWLLTFADAVNDEAFERGRRISHKLETNPPEGLREFVPGYCNVLLIFGDPTVKHQSWPIEEIAADLDSCASAKMKDAAIKEITVTYDGPDLQRVAQHNSLSTDEVVKIHADTIYKVYLLGFAPGFPYLGDLDSRIHTPRLETPRTVVPAGSVAIGGSHTGIYSIPNPGGWNLIGTTDVPLFAPTNESDNEKFYLHPGDRVKFIAT